jgi:hypothetical protein
LAMQPAGQDPEARLAPGTVTLPLCSRPDASPFWIMLLLVPGRTDHGIIVPDQRKYVNLQLYDSACSDTAVTAVPARQRSPWPKTCRRPQVGSGSN